MVKDRTAKRTIGSLMRKKLSDITNSQQQGQSKLTTTTHEEEEKPPETSSSDKDLCIQQLLKERMTLMKLLAEKNKMVEWSRVEMQMLQANVQKLQLQNWNLAQSNTHMLAELNLGKERIKALQHEILWRAALLKGDYNTLGKLDMNCDNNKGSSSPPQDGDEKAGKPSPKSGKNKQSSVNRRRCTRRRSTGSSSNSSPMNAPKEKAEHKRGCLRRQSARLERNEGEPLPLENLFEIEDANYLVIQPTRPSSSRKEVPRSSFRLLLRKSVDKAQSQKDTTNSSKANHLPRLLDQAESNDSNSL